MIEGLGIALSGTIFFLQRPDLPPLVEPVGTGEQESNDHRTDHDQKADVVELDEPDGAISFEPLAGCDFFQGDQIMCAMPVMPAIPKAITAAMAQANFRRSVGVGMGIPNV